MELCRGVYSSGYLLMTLKMQATEKGSYYRLEPGNRRLTLASPPGEVKESEKGWKGKQKGRKKRGTSQMHESVFPFYYIFWSSSLS